MNPTERALLLSLHPRFAEAILDGTKSVEIRRQRVAVPAGTPVVLYATTPIMALVGTARVRGVEVETPDRVWKAHGPYTAISRTEFDDYTEGSSTTSAVLLEGPKRLQEPISLAHMRTAATFQPPQSYRYLDRGTLRLLVTGHPMAESLLNQINTETAAAQPTQPLQGSANRTRTSLAGAAYRMDAGRARVHLRTA